jgi:DNA-binding transcriptional LysR family regulator
VLSTLAERHPELTVHAVVAEPEQALPALLARDLDLVVAEEYPGSPQPRLAGIDTADLFAEPIRLAHPRALGTPRTQAALARLADHPWVMEPPGSAARAWAVTVCRTAGFEPDVRYESSDLILHTRLVEAGHAAAFLPDLVWAGRRPSVPLRPLPRSQNTRRIFTAVRTGHARHPAIAALRTALGHAVAATVDMPSRRNTMHDTKSG